MNVAELDVSVNTKGLRPAARSIDALGKAAKTYKVDIKELEQTLQELSNAKLPVLGQGIQQFKSLAGSVSGLKGATNSFSSLAIATEKLVTKSSGLAEVAKHLASIKDSVVQMRGFSLAGLGTTTTRSGTARAPVDQQAKAQQTLMRQLEREGMMASVGYNKAAYLEQRAALLGVSEAAKPYIAQMRAAHGVAQQGTISTKQYNAAVRMIPAQFTDIATQLAGGQNPFLIMLQQGGQMRDMFGSVSVMLKAVGAELIKLLRNPLVLAAAAIAAVGYAIYDTAMATNALATAFAKSSGASGQTAFSMKAAAYAAMEYGASANGAVEASMALVQSNVISTNNFSQLISTVAKYSKAMGVDATKAVEDYVTINEKASQKILEVNNRYHTLTPAVYAQVLALEKEGKQLEANALANEEIRKAQQAVADTYKANRSIISGALDEFLGKLRSIKETALTIPSIRNLFVGADDAQRLRALQTELANIVEWEKAGLKGGEQRVAEINKEIAAIKERIKTETDAAAKQQQIAAENARINALMQGVANSDDKVKKAQAEADWDQVKLGLMQQAAFANKSKAEWAALEKKFMEGQLPLSTSLTKESEKQATAASRAAEKEENRLQKQAGLLASLQEKIRAAEEENNVLKGIEETYSTTNEYLVAASKLTAEAAKETNAKKKADLEILANKNQYLGSLVQENNHIKEREKIEKRTDDERKKAMGVFQQYALQTPSLIDAETAANEKLLRGLKAIEVTEKNIVAMKSAAEGKKITTAIQVSGDPVLQTALEWETKMAQIEQYKQQLTELGIFETTMDIAKNERQNAMFEAQKQRFMAMNEFNKTLMTTVEALGSTLSSNITGLVQGTSTLKDLMKSLGDTILSSVISAIVQMGVKWVQQQVIGQAIATSNSTMLTAAVQAQVAMTSMLAGQNAFAATAAIPVIGPVLAPGAAIAATAAAGAIGAGAIPLAAVAGMRSMMDNGGMLRSGQLATVGEYGPELVMGPAKVVSRRDTAKMTSGGNAPQVNVNVVNNAGVDVQQSVDREGNILMVLEKHLPGMMAREGGNPKSKLNQAQSSIYSRRRL